MGDRNEQHIIGIGPSHLGDIDGHLPTLETLDAADLGITDQVIQTALRRADGGDCTWKGVRQTGSETWALAMTADQADRIVELLEALVPPEEAALMDKLLEEDEAARALAGRRKG